MARIKKTQTFTNNNYLNTLITEINLHNYQEKILELRNKITDYRTQIESLSIQQLELEQAVKQIENFISLINNLTGESDSLTKNQHITETLNENL